MHNNGFLLLDSVLSLLIFTVIVLTLPGLIYIFNVDQLSLEQLDTYRELYVMTSRFESAEEYSAAAKIIFKEAGIPCEERLRKICS